MYYPLADLSTEFFEGLVVNICTQILGIGIKSFTKGKDGGKDAFFEGVAENYPSKAGPLKGKFVIQAKHTSILNASFSDASFSSFDRASSDLNIEIPKIKRLFESKQLDHYLLFSNRKLTGIQDQVIKEQITSKTGVQSVHLFSLDDINIYLKKYAELTDGLSAYYTPLQMLPNDLAEIVISFHKHREVFSTVNSNSKSNSNSLEPISIKAKNEINNLTDAYFKLIKKHAKDFDNIEEFLNEPSNEKLSQQYIDTIEELNSQIVAYKDNFDSFDKILEQVLTAFYNKDVDLKKNKQLTRTFLYFMYWKCDVGEKVGC